MNEDVGPANVDALRDEPRNRQRAALAAFCRRPGRRNQGLVIVSTGDGQGKTTAALGLLCRARGQGPRVATFQVIKATSGNRGAPRTARAMDADVVPLGSEFSWSGNDLERDRALTREGWERCRDAPPALIELAGPMTEMRVIQHPCAAGITAQKGLPFLSAFHRGGMPT